MGQHLFGWLDSVLNPIVFTVGFTFFSSFWTIEKHVHTPNVSPGLSQTNLRNVRGARD